MTRIEALNTYQGWARWILLIDTCVPLQAQLSRLFWWPLVMYLSRASRQRLRGKGSE